MTLIRKQPADAEQQPLFADVAESTGDSLPFRSVSRDSGIGSAAEGHIQIERLIEHELDHIHKRKELATALVSLSEHESYFAEHIRVGRDKAEWGACFKDPGGDITAWCKGLLGNDEDFIHCSQLLADHLYEVMRTRSISRGDLVASVFTLGTDPTRYIALMKLDPVTRRVRNFVGTGGGKRAEISIADNILPESKALTKCALIIPRFPDGSRDPQEAYLEMKLLDLQAGFRYREVAAFFYRDFLQTDLIPTERQRTQEFLRTGEHWINSCGGKLTPFEQQHFYSVRRSVLRTQQINVDAFVREALPSHPELRADLAERLLSAVSTKPRDEEEARGTFTVDKAIATPFVREVVYELDGGARLSVPSDRLDELVHIDSDFTPQGKHRIVIESQTLHEVTKR